MTVSVKGRPRRVAAAAVAAVFMGGAFAAAHSAFADGSKPASPASGKTDAALALALQTARPNSKGWTSVIVQTTPGTSAKDAEIALKQAGCDVFRRLPIIQSFAVRVPTKSLQNLTDLACIAHVSADVQTCKTDAFTVGHTGADIANAPVSADGFGLSGDGVTVAVLDSGVHDTNDFSSTGSNNNGGTGSNNNGSRIAASINFVPTIGKDGAAKVEARNVEDELGHGTHVAGIIAGNGANSWGSQYFHTFTGIAPDASLVNVRVLDSQGSGKVSDVLAGINWIVQNKARYGIRVLNVSQGHPVYESYTTDPLNKAVEAAWKAGIVVVCSAGNTGRIGHSSGAYPGDNEGYGTAYGTIQCPGNDPQVITVGAMKNMDGNRANDKVATYSSRGPSRLDMVMKPDIMAPGNRVVSVCVTAFKLDKAFGGSNNLRKSEYQTGGTNDPSGQYFELSGTSMAAPVVSGAAALLLNKYPTLLPDTVKARLMRSADKLVNPNGTPDVLTYGAGFLNIPAALNNTSVVASGTYAVSPKLKVNSNGTMSVFMDQILWGKADLTWPIDVGALQVLWGKAALDTAGSPLATSTTWGKARNVQADQALWGKARAANVDVSPTSVDGE